MIQSYLSNTATRFASKWLVFAIDLGTIGIAFVLSYIIRFNLTLDFDLTKLPIQLVLVLFIAGISFLITGSYKGIVRHTGVRDVYNIFNAVCLFSVMTIAIVIVNRKFKLLPDFTIPLGIIIINSLLAFIGLTATRFVFKYFYASIVNTNTQIDKKVMIYGAGESGILTYNALTSSTKSFVNVVGYIDEDRQKIGKHINGIRVYSPDILSEEFLKAREISEIIFSIHNIEQKKLRKLVEGMVEFSIKVKIVPPVEDWINGELSLSQIKQVQIEDLLDRAPIAFINDRLKKEFRGKTILVTGGAGSIGSEIVRQICKYEYKTLIILDQAESALYDLQQELKRSGCHNFIPVVGDVRDKNRGSILFQEFKPNIVFHAAAYKHVPLMEYNPYEAIKINIAGTKVMADLSYQYEVEKFVLISTDKAVNPTNIMGATKRIAEIYTSCQNQLGKTKYITTRFGNVLGSNGSVIPLFRKQIEAGGPITVTHKDITRYFMTIPEASQLVLEAGVMGEGGEIFIFDMGESVRIFDMAKNMIRLSGLRYPEDIDIDITGLRPGEKLYEELLANGENTLPTYHKKIMISKVRDLDFNWIRSKIEHLCVANMFFNADTVKLMKEIVPEFVSNNSDYCELDRKKVMSKPVKKLVSKIESNQKD
jgi:FlaA1/EpsC-like NDP-sugar epimerase